MKNGKIPDITEAEEKYVRSHYQDTGVPEMAKYLKRGAATLYAWMKDRSLEVYRAPRDRQSGKHPFRHMNRKLEQVVLARNIENGGKKYNG